MILQLGIFIGEVEAAEWPRAVIDVHGAAGAWHILCCHVSRLMRLKSLSANSSPYHTTLRHLFLFSCIAHCIRACDHCMRSRDHSGGFCCCCCCCCCCLHVIHDGLKKIFTHPCTQVRTDCSRVPTVGMQRAAGPERSVGSTDNPFQIEPTWWRRYRPNCDESGCVNLWHVLCHRG